jgi:hypothetical protein
MPLAKSAKPSQEILGSLQPLREKKTINKHPVWIAKVAISGRGSFPRSTYTKLAALPWQYRFHVLTL